nr:hypothetical protein [Mycobacterium uberis]
MSQLYLDEITVTIGFVVGKLAQELGGACVECPLACRILVSFDGCVQLVDDFGGLQPTAIIRPDGLQFTRLAGSHLMCPVCLQDIELGGDRDVAAQIVERLDFAT